MKTKTFHFLSIVFLSWVSSLSLFAQSPNIAAADPAKEHNKYLSEEERTRFKDIRNGYQSINRDINERFKTHSKDLNPDEMSGLRKIQHEVLIQGKALDDILNHGFYADDAEYKVKYEKVKSNYDAIILGINDRISAKHQNQEAIAKGEPGFIYNGTLIKNIYFDLNKSNLREAAIAELEKIQEIMKKDLSSKLEINGYACQLGSKKYNMELSAKRNMAVADWLNEHGIDRTRMTLSQHGEDKPNASNDFEKEGRELNRRVEFKISQ